MPIMDNPEVPPAVHVRVDHTITKDYAIRPIGAIETTVTAGLVDEFSGRAKRQIVKAAAVRDEGEPPGRIHDEGEPPGS
ncbi:hypothetical protein [Nocardia pseudovaccinii]|uniref:hypothetical protein n=1 Tax=Nocardia pseudovaccinii TaxID=189540 RepID=UPI000AAC9843|nr:hypothetical protein [Nocardia pseudovaccinii]